MIRSHLTPTIQPVNIRSITRDTGPPGNPGDQTERVVRRKKLGRCVAKGASLQAFGKPCRRYETLSVRTKTDIEFVHHTGVENMDPISGTTVVGIQIMRANAPTVTTRGRVRPT